METIAPADAWNDEYARQGIPSSHRDDPSGVLVWGLANLPFLGKDLGGALDLGCGTGRNALALAAAGYNVTGLDFSMVALDIARRRPGADRVTFLQGDVTDRLPAEDASKCLVTDVFVYFHQLSDDARRGYREEIRRVLAPNGTLLVSLATADDGYYGGCPRLSSEEVDSTVPIAWDPHAQVGNILLTRDQYIAEFADHFDLVMLWTKRKEGIMHGERYLRSTTATLWTVKAK